ncbi:MAG: tetratricopeptide repeat protein, partial [Planctomycetota bacterium]
EPNNAPALASIARLHARQNNHVEAVNYFAKASAADPADATILNDYAKSLSKQGQHGAAEAVIQKAIAADPSKSRYSNTLASVKYQMGQKEAALDVLQRANQPAVAHFNMAYLHYNAGAMGDAAKHLQACVACEPTAGDDTTVARAITQSKAMLERLGPAAGTMVANAPAAINAAKQVAGGVQSLTTMAGGTLSQVGAAAQSAARPAQSANYNGPATPPAQRVANLPTNPATTAKIAPVAPVKPMAAAAPTTPIQSAPSAPAATAPAAAQPAPTTSGEAHNFMMPVMR